VKVRYYRKDYTVGHREPDMLEVNYKVFKLVPVYDSDISQAEINEIYEYLELKCSDSITETE